MSCLPCLRPYFLEKYFNFAFFLEKDKKKKIKNRHAFYWEYVYYNHYYNKECLADYCGKRKQRVWTFPLLVYVVLLHYLFLLCKMTTRPIWLGTQGETGVDAGPALLSLVRVSAGWCSFLSPASQSGCKPKFIQRGLHLTKCTKLQYLILARKAWYGPFFKKLIFMQKRTLYTLWNHVESWGEAHR